MVQGLGFRVSGALWGFVLQRIRAVLKNSGVRIVKALIPAQNSFSSLGFRVRGCLRIPIEMERFANCWTLLESSMQ